MGYNRINRNLRTLVDHLGLDIESIADEIDKSLYAMQDIELPLETRANICHLLYNIRENAESWSSYVAGYNEATIVDHDEAEDKIKKLEAIVLNQRGKIQELKDENDKLLDIVKYTKAGELIELFETRLDLLVKSEANRIKISKQGKGSQSFKYNKNTSDQELINYYINNGYKIDKQMIDHFGQLGGLNTFQGIKLRLQSLGVYRGRKK